MIVGLTGGIGSGKSVVASVFSALGAAVFNSDDSAKAQYQKPEIKKRVIALLGAEAYTENGALNKKYISDRIFSDTTLLAGLNEIIHPEVKKEFAAFCDKNQGKIIIKESALLFETGLYKELDSVIVVVSPVELRLKRVMKRDGLSSEQVMMKIKSQLSDDEKIKLADYIIHNNEKDFIITQCLSLYQAWEAKG